MGAIEVHGNAFKPSAHRSAGLQINKSGGCVKPRVIHTYSPRVYKIQPEEFLELVQKLTGQSVPKPPTTFQFFEIDASKSDCKTGSRSHYTTEVQSNDFENSGEALASPLTSHLLGALPSPRLVTLNFLPLLAATPRARSS